MLPMYIPGRFRTGSRPSSTWIDSAPYSAPIAAAAAPPRNPRRPCAPGPGPPRGAGPRRAAAPGGPSRPPRSTVRIPVRTKCPGSMQLLDF